MDDTVFAGREEAGQFLADRYDGPKEDLVVLGIARGGIAVAYPIALRFEAPMDVITARKLPIPWSPEMGFGAIAPDGSVELNREVVRSLGISQKEIDDISGKVLVEVHRREKVYRSGRPPVPLKGKNVILVDDGLATGYTMIASIEMVKKQGASYVAAAAAVSPYDTAEQIRRMVDKLIVLRVSRTYSFAVANFYRDFHDMKDGEVLDYMEKA
ncbi:MAG: phosphoribosyltransferase, partial [Candidatus Geothermincolia bacterium]